MKSGTIPLCDAMIHFEIKKRENLTGEFSYDLKALALSFFPEKECEVTERQDWSGQTGYPVSCCVDGVCILDVTLPEPYTKNIVKRVVYQALAGAGGRQLPWGILTGIRPAKIPLRMRMAGMAPEAVYDSLKREYLVRDEKIRLAMEVAEKEFSLTKNINHEKGYNLYIGIPFCPSICRYCSFSSYEYAKYEEKTGDYLRALEKEMEWTKKAFADYELHSIYVGGGTPTALKEEQLQTLMDMIHRHFPVKEAMEFTVEAGRPDSLDGKKLQIMKEAGVTRISINPQTMKQHTLDLLGRKHTVEQIKEVFYLAREMGFDNINMDLILGLPEEDEVDFFNSLHQVCDLDPDSITLHTLVIKRASRLRREQMEQGGEMRPEDTLVPALQLSSFGFMTERGYEPYYMYRQKNKAGTTYNTNQENVAYAKEGKECLYNIFIMEELETIVALGSGGSTKYVAPGENRLERIENVKSVEDYILRIDEMIERKKKIWH